MPHHDVFGNSVIYDFFRQTINAIIETCQSDGNATELASIVTKLESLRDQLQSEDSYMAMPTDEFPGG